MDYVIKNTAGERVGRVMRFAGEPPATRWWAYSVVEERKAGFRTQREAIAWLEAEYKRKPR